MPRQARPVGRLERTPHVFDLGAIDIAPHLASARQQRRMDPGRERAAVVRAAGDVREPRPGVGGECSRPVHAQGVIGEPRPRDHEPRVAHLAERARDVVELGPVPALLLLQEPRLVAGTAQDVLGDVPEAGPAGVQHDDPSAGGRRLPESQMQDRNLLLGVQTRDEDHLRPFHVAIRHAHPAGSDLTLERGRLRGRAGGRGRSSGTPFGRASTARSSPRPSAGRRSTRRRARRPPSPRSS